MKQLSITLLLFLSYHVSFSINGYKLSFETTNMKGKTIVISYYYGSFNNFKAKDTVSIKTNKETVILQYDRKIYGGIYRLNFKGSKEFTTLIIDNGDNMRFRLSNNTIKSLKPLNSTKNKLYLDYTFHETNEYRNKFISKYPSSVGALFFQLENKIRNIPEEETKRKDYVKTFWAKIDIHNPQLKFLPNFYSTLNKYTRVLPINNENYSNSIHYIINRMDCNSRNYELFVSWFFRNMRYNEKYNLEKTFLQTYYTQIDSLGCKIKNRKLLNTIVNKLDEYKSNPTDSLISDFELQDSTNKNYTLSEIYTEYDYTFLAFYDPNCHHCQKSMPLLNQYFNKLSPTISIKKIAVLNVEETKDWNKFIKENDLKNWLHLYSEKKNNTYKSDFNSFSNPKFFLIDKNGKLISRTGNIQELNRILLTK